VDIVLNDSSRGILAGVSPGLADPHSFNENLTNNINSLVYDRLVQRDKDLKLEPALAVSWQQVNPTTAAAST
jgi:ABC-type transport system substrate-binding protein